jgi:histone H3/H4
LEIWVDEVYEGVKSMSDVEDLRDLPLSRVDKDALIDQARMAKFAIINSFLAQQQILLSLLGMRPAHATVYLTIGMATIQRFVRQPGDCKESRGVVPLAQEQMGMISRRAISSSTGLPRETVRRVVSDLIASGDVIEVGVHGVRSRFGELISTETQNRLLELAVETSRLSNELAKLKVIVQR